MYGKEGMRTRVDESVESEFHVFGKILVCPQRWEMNPPDVSNERQRKVLIADTNFFFFFFFSSSSRSALLSFNAIALERERPVNWFTRIDTGGFKFAVKTSRKHELSTPVSQTLPPNTNLFYCSERF